MCSGLGASLHPLFHSAMHNAQVLTSMRLVVLLCVGSTSLRLYHGFFFRRSARHVKYHPERRPEVVSAIGGLMCTVQLVPGAGGAEYWCPAGSIGRCPAASAGARQHPMVVVVKTSPDFAGRNNPRRGEPCRYLWR